jgi:hypothetical protein
MPNTKIRENMDELVGILGVKERKIEMISKIYGMYKGLLMDDKEPANWREISFHSNGI